MDANAEIADVKRQIAELKGDVSASRGETKSLLFAVSAISGELKDRDKEASEKIKAALLKELNSIGPMGNVDLLRPLSHLFREA